MKIKSIILAILIFSGCTGKNNNEDNTVVVNTLKQSILSVNNISIIDELHEKYQNHNVKYYNDLNCLGLGVVNPKQFNFQVVIDTITRDGFNIEDIEKQEYLIPILWKPDYLIFYMPVVHISNNYYEVQANTERRVFVNKEDFDFYTWEDLLKNQTVSILANKGYLKPDTHSEILFDSDEISMDEITLIVEKVENDWIFVREEFNETKIEHFWVFWKDKNKLLIKPIFLM